MFQFNILYCNVYFCYAAFNYVKYVYMFNDLKVHDESARTYSLPQNMTFYVFLGKEMLPNKYTKTGHWKELKKTTLNWNLVCLHG